jgi:hypothetical protein
METRLSEKEPPFHNVIVVIRLTPQRVKRSWHGIHQRIEKPTLWKIGLVGKTYTLVIGGRPQQAKVRKIIFKIPMGHIESRIRAYIVL